MLEALPFNELNTVNYSKGWDISCSILRMENGNMITVYNAVFLVFVLNQTCWRHSYEAVVVIRGSYIFLIMAG